VLSRSKILRLENQTAGHLSVGELADIIIWRIAYTDPISLDQKTARELVRMVNAALHDGELPLTGEKE